MATFITWAGTTNGSLSTGSNWIGGVVPGATEWGLFPESVTNPPTSNMDGLTASLGGVLVAAGARYDIGVSGDPMKVVASAWRHYGSGKLWMDVDAISTACAIRIDCQPGGNADIAGSFSGNMKVRVIRGGTAEAPVQIGATFGAANLLVVAYRRNPNTDCYVDIASGAGALTELDQRGGQVIAANNITDAFIAAGLLRTTGAGTMGTLRVGPNARAEYFSTGTMTLGEISGAISFLKKGTAQTATDLTAYPNSVLDYDPDLLTITNGLLDLRRA